MTELADPSAGTLLGDVRVLQRATNYLAVAQIYLQDNVLLEQPLAAEHVKPRLLGHWGTCPGLNLVHAHLNRVIVERELDALLVTGPGHGAPATLANLYLEGSLADVYPEYTLDRAGLERFVRAFSWPTGFPSHISALTPGAIHEGGELGYALSVAFGAALDNPELLVACVVGDGEAETGPTATAWHSSKFVDPATSGVVLPIVHLNGYKIASPTIYGTMSNDELAALFAGLGWSPVLVEGRDVDEPLAQAFDQALDLIAELRADPGSRPRWPVVLLRTPKGLGIPPVLDGKRIEGSYRSHQVPAKDVRENPEHLAYLERWLGSYRPAELWDGEGRPAPAVRRACPEGARRLGASPHANGGLLRRPLELPALERHAVDVASPGSTTASATEVLGGYLADVMRASERRRDFRIVCPDELESNLLGGVLAATGRAYTWPHHPDDATLRPDGRVMEILSEHTCQGWLQGYLLTGRHGLFPCYEAFATIVDSMTGQYAKWLKMARETRFRAPVAALNYLLSSDTWRQDHNGYSHQGPGFINSLLTKQGWAVRVYLPPDANTLLATLDHCLRTTDCVNLVIATKQPLPQWLALDDARAHVRAGASVWDWASTAGHEPDVVLACAGNIPTVETLAAVTMLRQHAPGLAVRVVNVTDLLALDSARDHPHGLGEDEFEAVFTRHSPVVFAFHGYPSAVHQLVYKRPDPHRFHVRGYAEEGTTTTPFDMLLRNRASRWHLAAEAVRRAPGWTSAATDLATTVEQLIREHGEHIVRHGVDPEEITGWRWSAPSTPAPPA